MLFCCLSLKILITNLKNTKVDIDVIPIRLLKKIINYIAEPLTFIINKCFTLGTFPDQLKIARVTPIFKKGEHTNPSNYRPISSLGYMSKIFESCLKNRLYAFLNKFKLITNSQFGFLKQISTNDALNHLTEFLYKGLNSREHISCIFVDLRKAYDTVHQSILLSKFELIGVRGIAPELFMSF